MYYIVYSILLALPAPKPFLYFGKIMTRNLKKSLINWIKIGSVAIDVKKIK